MATIDLDQARAARRETENRSITVRLGGADFELPPEMPFEIIERLGELRGSGEEADGAEDERNAAEVAAALLGIFKLLIGDEQYPNFMRARPSMEDLQVLLEGVLKEYGVNLGESEASPTS